jgi:hypothetical protein
MTFAGQSFASLGVTPGTYTYTWGSGSNANSAVLQIGSAATAAPAPPTLTLVGLASLLGLAYAGHRSVSRSAAP